MLLYRALKILSRSTFPIYCRKISIDKKEMLELQGPLLIACNHPNSFLDGIVLSTLFKHPVHSLARGDAFYNKFFAPILYSLGMLPVYRLREGADKLEGNYDTFRKCRDIFKKNGIVLIFSEGLCINEWHLRKLKKGTARLAIESWKEDIPLTVLPAGINYQSFHSFGKNIILNFGEPISRNSFDSIEETGETILHFNKRLSSELERLVIEADGNNRQQLRSMFAVPTPLWKQILLLLPAIAGYILHLPQFMACYGLTEWKAKGSDHRDAILHALMILTYPVYVSLLTGILYLQINCVYSLLLFILAPLSAWSSIQLKPQFK